MSDKTYYEIVVIKNVVLQYKETKLKSRGRTPRVKGNRDHDQKDSIYQ